MLKSQSKYKIYQPSRVDPSAEIGEGTKIGAFCDIGKNVVIGKNCNIQAHITISDGCKIGDWVFIGPNTSLLNDKYAMLEGGELQPVTIEDNARIGGGVTILPNVTVKRGGFVGAGAVVTKDVESYTIVFGVPAKLYDRY